MQVPRPRSFNKYMDIVRYLSRCGFASVGKTVVLLGIVACLYQLYRRWKRKRAIKKLAGKIVLITGASSGLGEGTYGFNCLVQQFTAFSSAVQGVSQCGCQADTSITEYTATGEAQVST